MELSNTETLSKKITASDGTEIIEILSCSNFFSEYIEGLSSSYFLGKSFYLEAFSGAIYLPSLQEAPFPEIYPEMNAAEKIAAMLKIEEEYPFIGLRFHLKKGTGNWTEISTARLQNKGREINYPFTIPYLTINELKILGPSDRLGISIVNYGSGVLGVGDYINFNADFRFSLDLVAKPSPIISAGLPYGIEIDSNAPTRFRVANAARAVLYVTNTGNFDVWIAGTSDVAVGNGIFLARNGNGSLTEKVLTSEFWAIADGGTSKICGLEASYG